MTGLIEKLWYGPKFFALPLLPLALLWWLGAAMKRLLYRAGVLRAFDAPCPVIVVGNIVAGGTGKTPLTIWLTNRLKAAGFRPGVVTRGYKGKARTWPQQVRPDSDASMVGDEPVLIAQQTGCLVAAGPDRKASVAKLCELSDCDIIVCDDGLQHYALGRDLEIAVLDSRRRLGNGFCIPAGPLREGAWRLRSVDFIVANGVARTGEFAMSYRHLPAVNVLDPSSKRMLGDFRGKQLHAAAGIGNPQRFFEQLRNAGLAFDMHRFADHHDFVASDLRFDDNAPVLMTEKDAVKCRSFATADFWYVPIVAEVDDRLWAEAFKALADRGIAPSAARESLRVPA
jgi:tetraacyldisaccharide 4'-kinase